MSRLWGTKTHENLLRAFSGEAQSERRYRWFADAADAEGHAGVAEGLRRIAEAEAGHAGALLAFLADVGDPTTDRPIGETRLNLAAALASELEGCAGAYPEFARAARAEGFPEISGWFEEVARAEERHATRLRELLATVG